MSREMDFPPIFPPCPGSFDRESLGVPQSTGTGDSSTGFRQRYRSQAGFDTR